MDSYQTFRSALALNNMGVSMMNNKCYMQALETLKEAMSLIHDSTHSSTQKALDEFCLNTDVIEEGEIHQRALRRLANPQPLEISCLDVQGVSYNENVQSMITSLGKQLSQCTLTPIRIDDLSGTWKDDADFKDFMTPLLVHNLGVAHLILSMRTNLSKSKAAIKKAPADPCYIKAIRLLRISYLLLLRSTTRNVFEDVESNYCLAIILHSLTEAYQKSGKKGEIVLFSKLLKQVKAKLGQNVASRLFNCSSRTAAAA